MPRISVIMPTYNCATYITQAVESVLAQSFHDLELIIVDDGSTDETRQVLESCLDRVIYVYQENQGESVARNQGIKISKGEYIAFLDSDDLWLPTNLERQVVVLDAHPDAVLAYSYCYYINESGERIAFRGSDRGSEGEEGLHSVLEKLVMGNVIANPGTVLVRKRFLSMPVFDAAIQWGEDWDLWLQLALRGPFVFVPEALACYRMRRPGRRLQIEATDEFVLQNEAILRKVFDTLLPDHADLSQLRPGAFAALYLRSALYNFELGDVDRGPSYIGRALEADPDQFRNGKLFARQVANQGLRIGNEKGDLDNGIAFVKCVFDHLPPTASKMRLYRPYALSEIHAAAAFSQFERGDRANALQNVVRAICHYPARASNRGLVSIGAQALLGGKLWAR